MIGDNCRQDLVAIFFIGAKAAVEVSRVERTADFILKSCFLTVQCLDYEK